VDFYLPLIAEAGEKQNDDNEQAHRAFTATVEQIASHA